MSETPYNKPQSDTPQEKFNEAFDSVKDRAQEALRNPDDVKDKAQNLLKQYQPLLLAVGATYLLFKIEKRMVTKIVRKDRLVIKEHLNLLTLGIEDLSEVLGMRPTEAWTSAIADLKKR